MRFVVCKSCIITVANKARELMKDVSLVDIGRDCQPNKKSLVKENGEREKKTSLRVLSAIISVIQECLGIQRQKASGGHRAE